MFDFAGLFKECLTLLAVPLLLVVVGTVVGFCGGGSVGAFVGGGAGLAGGAGLLYLWRKAMD